MDRAVPVWKLEIGDPCFSNVSCPREAVDDQVVVLKSRLDSLGKPEEKVVCCHLKESNVLRDTRYGEGTGALLLYMQK